MIKGAKGLGTDPDLIVQGIKTIYSDDEFYRLNTLFQDGRSGYKSFDEMINGEFEYSNGKDSNEKEFNIIKSQLQLLEVPYTIYYTKYLTWPQLKLTNPKKIAQVLSDLPDGPQPVSTVNTITPSNVKMNQRCVSGYNKIFANAKSWLKNWLNSDKTKEKFVKNYREANSGYKFGPVEIETIFKNYNKIIDQTPMKFYNDATTEIDGKKLSKEYHEDVGAFAMCGTNIIYMNCGAVDNSSDDAWRLSLTIHEIQHLLHCYFPLNPFHKVYDVFKLGTKNSTQNSPSSQRPKKIKSEFNFDLTWLEDYSKYIDRVQGEEYSCEHTEKDSNLLAVRSFLKITPNQSLTKEMFLPYLKGDKWFSDISLILSCWYKQGYPDFNTFINGLNSLAKNKKNIPQKPAGTQRV